jgi:hypothetical protein
VPLCLRGYLKNVISKAQSIGRYYLIFAHVFELIQSLIWYFLRGKVNFAMQGLPKPIPNLTQGHKAEVNKYDK